MFNPSWHFAVGTSASHGFRVAATLSLSFHHFYQLGQCNCGFTSRHRGSGRCQLDSGFAWLLQSLQRQLAATALAVPLHRESAAAYE